MIISSTTSLLYWGYRDTFYWMCNASMVSNFTWLFCGRNAFKRNFSLVLFWDKISWQERDWCYDGGRKKMEHYDGENVEDKVRKNLAEGFPMRVDRIFPLNPCIFEEEFVFINRCKWKDVLLLLLPKGLLIGLQSFITLCRQCFTTNLSQNRGYSKNVNFFEKPPTSRSCKEKWVWVRTTVSVCLYTNISSVSSPTRSSS